MVRRRQCSRPVPHIKCQRKGSARKIGNERMTLNCVRSVFNRSGALTRCVISSYLILIALKTKYSQQKRRTTAAKSNKRLTKWAIVKPTSPSIRNIFHFIFSIHLWHAFAPMFVSYSDDIGALAIHHTLEPYDTK